MKKINKAIEVMMKIVGVIQFIEYIKKLFSKIIEFILL